MRHLRPFPLALVIIALCSVALLSACSTTAATGVNTPPSQSTTSSLPTATTAGQSSATPSPSSAPITSCSQVGGFGSAGAISAGSHFSEVSFPANTVGFVQQTFEDNNYQFRIISACTNSTSMGAIRSYFAANLPPTGFAQSSTIPYHGNANSACGDPYCWYNGSTHPSFQASRYLSLESVTAVGSVVTYNLRLCITPLVFKNITIQGTYHYDFDLVDNTDVWWEQVTGTQREMVPENGAQITNIGVTNFTNVTAAQLRGRSYSTTPIDGNNDSTNKLVNGDVWAVHTDGGHYVKVLVVTYGYNIVLNYVVYDYSF